MGAAAASRAVPCGCAGKAQQGRKRLYRARPDRLLPGGKLGARPFLGLALKENLQPRALNGTSGSRQRTDGKCALCSATGEPPPRFKSIHLSRYRKDL